MNPQLPPVRGAAGYVLAAVVILVFVVLIIGAGFMSLAGYETRNTQQDLDGQRAFWLAEGARERAIRWITQQSRPPESDVPIYQSMAGPDGGTYTVDCRVDTTALYQVEKAFVLDCVGQYRGRDRRIRDRVRMTSFAQFAYFTDNEVAPGGSTIWFATGDLIGGRLHTNGTIHILGNPRFIEGVTSASDHMIGYQNFWIGEPSDWPAGSNHPTFDQGFTLDAPEVELPTRTLDLRQEALAGGVYIGPEAELELGVMGSPAGVSAPGWFRHRNLSPPNDPWTSVRITTLASRVLYCNNDLHVKGVLDGELTVASNRSVRIEDDLTYLASDAQGAPRPGCDDLLGIVAGENIILVNNAANRTNLIIDGVLMALNTSITAQDYNSGSLRGVLTIWGGLIQKYRGAVGTVNNGAIVTGYRKDYHYDARVTAHTPPAFPLTGVYEEVTWTETWDDSDPF
jgi:hypothetical protein